MTGDGLVVDPVGLLVASKRASAVCVGEMCCHYNTEMGACAHISFYTRNIE